MKFFTSCVPIFHFHWHLLTFSRSGCCRTITCSLPFLCQAWWKTRVTSSYCWEHTIMSVAAGEFLSVRREHTCNTLIDFLASCKEPEKLKYHIKSWLLAVLKQSQFYEESPVLSPLFVSFQQQIKTRMSHSRHCRTKMQVPVCHL